MQKSVSDIFQARRDKSLSELRSRQAEVAAAAPGFFALEQALAAARAAKDGEEISALLKERERTLSQAGFPADYLDRRHECPHCGDTGIREDGSECVCMKKTRCLAAARLSNLERLSGERFESWDFSLFPDGAQRESSKKLYSLCSDYANGVPKGNVRNLLLLGGTGLGKSFALHSVGNRALENGAGVRLTTAPRFFASEMERIRGGADDNAALFDAELLIIDDLGAEPANSSVAADSLFALLDYRYTVGRHTAAASNLSASDLVQRYGSRITSRLMDANCSAVLALSGRDLRLFRHC